MRYLPLSDGDRAHMLQAVGAASIDDLFEDIPKEKRLEGFVNLPLAQGEMAVERALSTLARQNTPAGEAAFFVGAGAYRHHIPASVDHLIQRSEFMTAYTPYQPEISQGTLQALFEFQTQVALLTGMDVANASMYDGATACAEAVLMAHRVTRRRKALVSGSLHPHYVDTIRTSSHFEGYDLHVGSHELGSSQLIELAAQIDEDTSCVVVQNPDFFGRIDDLRAIAEAAHNKGALLVVAVPEVVSLGLITPPGEMGADIVVGEGQSLGVGLNFGGPYLGLFATRQKYVRQMPGRLCGQTQDAESKRGFVLTLSTREQHIRREKATSNICTNAGLCSLAFTIHVTLLGEEGLRKLARLNYETAVALSEELSNVPGVELITEQFFNEFAVRLPRSASEVVNQLADKGVMGGVPASRLLPGHETLENILIVAATETNTEEDIEAFASALKEVLA